jgi:hypothetical protein
MFYRLIVQWSERTAHNGLAVGSNPTKPKHTFLFRIYFTYEIGS